MTSSEVWDEATAERYDQDSAERFTPEALNPTVDFLAGIAKGGPTLEFAVGTGRVSIPLATRGLQVTGIELSQPMVAQLRRKASEAELPVFLGDMSTTVVPGAGEFALVFLVWNSISNLRTQEEQTRCFQNAAHHLRLGGRFVIELWVPPIHRLQPGERIAPMSLDEDHMVFDTYDVVSQQCSSHHLYREPDGTYRSDTGQFRYLWPSECDLMAQIAGMELEDRYSDWRRSPFTAESDSHVSVWRKRSP